MSYVQFIKKLARHRLEFTTSWDGNYEYYQIYVILSNIEYVINEYDTELMEEVWSQIKLHTGIED